MSMTAKSRNSVDKKSGANLQADGHVEVPTQGAKDSQEPEEEDSSPTCSPSSSLAQRLPSGHPWIAPFLDSPIGRRLAA